MAEETKGTPEEFVHLTREQTRKMAKTELEEGHPQAVRQFIKEYGHIVFCDHCTYQLMAQKKALGKAANS